MNINVTQEALSCFLGEWGYEQGDKVRIFVRYSGGSEDAFAFGIMKDSPMYPAVSEVKRDITFFMEQNDTWYLDGKNLTIDYEDDMIVFQLK
jgi:uncharacterized protein YneR